MSQPLRIGLNLFSNDPFWIEANEAVYQRSQQLGIELVPIYASYLLPQLSDQGGTTPLDAVLRQDPARSRITAGSEQERGLIEELLKLKVGAIIGWEYPDPITSHVLDAGIPIIAQGSEILLHHPLLVRRQGLYSPAHLLGTYLAEQLNGRGHILVAGGLTLNKSAGDGRNRVAGFRDVFQSFPQIQWSHLPTFWDYETAYSQIYPVLEALSEPLDAIVGLSDTIALAGRDAARVLGRLEPHTLIGGINGDPLALAAIAEGSFTATVNTSATDLGQQMVEVACQLAQGLPHQDELNFNRMRLVTSQNVTEVAGQKLIDNAHLPHRMLVLTTHKDE